MAPLGMSDPSTPPMLKSYSFVYSRSPSGWRHITTRGLGRRTLFHLDHDHEHFIELLDVMIELCCIRLFTWS